MGRGILRNFLCLNFPSMVLSGLAVVGSATVAELVTSLYIIKVAMNPCSYVIYSP